MTEKMYEELKGAEGIEVFTRVKIIDEETGEADW